MEEETLELIGANVTENGSNVNSSTGIDQS